MKYWEIIADKLSVAGWSWGYCNAFTRDGWLWIVDAHREGRRYIVHSDELLSAFLSWSERRAFRISLSGIAHPPGSLDIFCPLECS